MSLLLLALALTKSPAPVAAEPARVPATELLARAEAALRESTHALGVPVKLTAVGRLRDVRLPGDAAYELRVGPMPAASLRPRVAVPVEIHVGGRRVSTANVWFAVSAQMPAPVYTADFAKAQDAQGVRVREGQADLARTRGEPPSDLDAVAGLRLRHAVRAGEPLLASDFEVAPDVQAQQVVQIESVHGPVRIRTTGRALADARLGEFVAVLPSHAERPVRARVVSPQAVLIED